MKLRPIVVGLAFGALLPSLLIGQTRPAGKSTQAERETQKKTSAVVVRRAGYARPAKSGAPATKQPSTQERRAVSGTSNNQRATQTTTNQRPAQTTTKQGQATSRSVKQIEGVDKNIKQVQDAEDFIRNR